MMLSQNFCAYFTILMFNFNFFKVIFGSGRAGPPKRLRGSGYDIPVRIRIGSGRTNPLFCGSGRVAPLNAD